MLTRSYGPKWVYMYFNLFIFLIFRYLYSGLLPSPDLKGGMIPIFYFLNASHSENAFRHCLHKFYHDVKKVRNSLPRYEHCSVEPKQCITDMSLVIFRPALGNFYIKSMFLNVSYISARLSLLWFVHCFVLSF